MKMKIKVNDKVQVMSGKDKGKTGKVLQILPDMNKVVAEGINVMYKHLKAKSKTEKGQRVQFNGPVMLSNLMLLCPKCNKASRLGIRISENTGDEIKKTKARFCKKCNEVID
jgi:large subunit ribosomal protein L24